MYTALLLLTEERQADDEVRDKEGSCSVESVGSLLDECSPVF